MQLHVVGCSPAWPNPGGAQSGYLVEEDGRRLLLDCGPGVLPRLRRLEPWPRLDAIVITHFHLDHWGDLVPWAFGGLFGAGRDQKPPELWLPHGGRETLHGLDPVLYANAILELFEVHEYEETTPFTAAGFELLAYRMLHYALESYGLRASGGFRPTPAATCVAVSPTASQARRTQLFARPTRRADGGLRSTDGRRRPSSRQPCRSDRPNRRACRGTGGASRRRRQRPYRSARSG